MLTGLAVIGVLLFVGYFMRRWLERRRIQALLEREHQEFESLKAEDPELARQIEEGVFDDDDQFDYEDDLDELDQAESRPKLDIASVKNVDGVAERAVLVVIGNKQLNITGIQPEFIEVVKSTTAKVPVAGRLMVTEEMEEQVATEFVSFLAYHLAQCIENIPGFDDFDEQAELTASIVNAIGARTIDSVVSARFEEYWGASEPRNTLDVFGRHVGNIFGLNHYPVVSMLARTFAPRFVDLAGVVVASTPKVKT